MTEKILALARELGRIESELNAALELEEKLHAQIVDCEKKIEKLDEEKLHIVDEIANIAAKKDNSSDVHNVINAKIVHLNFY